MCLVNVYTFALKPKLILVNCSSLVTIHPTMQRFWTLIWACISSISISLTSSWKDVSSKCCWKKYQGVFNKSYRYQFDRYIKQNTWLRHRFNKFNNLSTKFKPIDVINLTSWFHQINVGTTMVPIENSFGFVANIKSSSLLDIPQWKS